MGERQSIKVFSVVTAVLLSLLFSSEKPFIIIFYLLLSITDKPLAILQSAPENQGAGPNSVPSDV